MKILREVKCSERLPNKNGYYFVKYEDGQNLVVPFYIGSEGFGESYTHWFEEVDLDLKSEEILPLDDRVIAHCESFEYLSKEYDLAIKALEAAELEIAESKASKSAVRSNAKYIEQTVLKKFAEDNERLSKDAKERYEKAFSNISWECIPSNIDKEQIKFNLKIAAGIN